MFGAGDLTCHVFHDFNVTFDEKGSTCGTIRKVQWTKIDKDPDEEKAKIEIRKIYVNADGEKMGKGYTFSTPEGPGELVVGMIDAGFGDTKQILRAVRKRRIIIPTNPVSQQLINHSQPLRLRFFAIL